MSPNPPDKRHWKPAKKSFMESYREALDKEKSAREKERQKKLKALEAAEKKGEAGEEEAEAPVVAEAPRKKTREEKQAEHLARIYKTLVASVLGILTGVISYLVIEPQQVTGIQAYTILAFFIMAAGIVVQKHIFALVRIGKPTMGAKDWFYQGFMTFAFWFIAWTILLTQGT